MWSEMYHTGIVDDGLPPTIIALTHTTQEKRNKMFD